MKRNLRGQRFGRLVALRPTAERKRECVVWTCRCDCGKIVRRSTDALHKIKSCGCLRVENSETIAARFLTTHGQAGKQATLAYLSYLHAKARCTNRKDDKWMYYGGRGIQFRFQSFEDFFAELGPRPTGKTLDRIDNDGHYETGNIRWATKREQMLNRRKRRVTAKQQHGILLLGGTCREGKRRSHQNYSSRS